MAALEDFVSVSIQISAASPARATFAVPLIASFHTKFPELVRSYSRLTDLLADGFVATDAEYVVASKFFAQNPRVPSVKLGRLTGTQTARVVKLLASAKNSTTYEVIINGTSFEFTSDSSATAAEIATGLVSAINAGTEPVTASLDTNNLVLTGDVAGVDFTVDIADESLWASIQDTSTARSTLATDLAALLASDDAWYALALTRNNADDIVAAAGFVQSNKRVLLATAIDFGAIDTAADNLAANTTNLLGQLEAAGYTRTLAVFTKHDADHIAAALGGRVLPLTVGSWTAHAKTLSGVQPSVLTSTEQANVEANRGNHYQTVAGISLTQKGWMSSERFFDEVVILDWTEARIKEGVIAALASANGKIPYTEEGAGIVEGVIVGVLKEGERNGAFVEGSGFARAPDIATVSSIDKAARALTNVEFGATLQGAIHTVEIRGTLSL